MLEAINQKEMAIKLISSMPYDSTIDDIIYLLYIRRKIEEGINDVNSENLLTKNEVEKELEQWLK